MKFAATPVTAAVAGIISAAAWPFLWPLFNDPASSSGLLLIVGMLLFIALPAHALVVGFGRSQNAAAGVDTAMLKRIGAWLLAAAATAAVIHL